MRASSDAENSPREGWLRTGDRRHYLVALETLFTAPIAPNATYQLRVSLRRPSSHGTRTESTRLETLAVRANDRGEIWPY